MLIRQAVLESENFDLDNIILAESERLILAESEKESELELTEKALEEAILLESRKAYFDDMYKKYNL
jgi:hypothetical protein